MQPVSANVGMAKSLDIIKDPVQMKTAAGREFTPVDPSQLQDLSHCSAITPYSIWPFPDINTGLGRPLNTQNKDYSFLLLNDLSLPANDGLVALHCYIHSYMCIYIVYYTQKAATKKTKNSFDI